MKVAILGVGRSGTTALYQILQEILNDQLKKVEFIFEPFIWDREVFNKKLCLITDEFQYMRSLSIDGLYHHQQLPLFISDPAAHLQNQYIKHLFGASREGTSHVLMKCIRANGRYKLLKALAPDCKFLFILRNPIDSLNSAIAMFSLLGEDFYKSDFPKFTDEVNSLYGAELSPDTISEKLEREVLYWYYMNRFALENFSKDSNAPFIMCYEHFSADRPGYIRKICEYLGLDYKESYNGMARRQAGPSYGTVNLTEKEFQVLRSYLPRYMELLNRFSIEHHFVPETILQKYIGQTKVKKPIERCYGKTPIVIRKLYKQERQKLIQEQQQLKQQLAALQKENHDLQDALKARQPISTKLLNFLFKRT